MQFCGTLYIKADYPLSETAEILGKILGVKFNEDALSDNPYAFDAYCLGAGLELIGVPDVFMDDPANPTDYYTLVVHDKPDQKSLDISERLAQVLEPSILKYSRYKI